MAVHRLHSTASIVCFMLCFIRGVAEIVTKPNGTEVVVGHSTYLNCSSNNPQEIHWFHTPFGSNQDRSFVYGYNQFYKEYVGRFAIDGNQANGAYNLVIQSVKVEDAGLFECQDQNGQGKKASAQLTVLDANPTCEPHIETLQIVGPNNCGIEPGQLVLSCSVKYHGNEAPIMKWSKTGDKNAISEGVTHQVTDNNLIEYNLTIKGNANVKDGESYYCNTTRSAALSDGCKSGEIKVTGTGAESPTYAASEICEPYIKPYRDAIICFFLIILPAAIGGTIFAFWYLIIHRPKKLKNRESASDNPRPNNRPAAMLDPGTAEEMASLTSATSSGECSDGPEVKIITLENQLKTSSRPLDRRDKTINELTQKNKLKTEKIKSLELENSEKIKSLELENREKIKSLELENREKIKSLELENSEKIKSLKLKNDQVQAKLKDLEQRLYPKENIDYLDKPVLAHTIELSEHGKEISEKHNEMSEENEGKSEKNEDLSVKNEEKSAQNKEMAEVYEAKSIKNEGKSEKNNEKSEKNKEKPERRFSKRMSENNDGKSEKKNTKSENNIKGKAINGIAVLGKQLFVATKCIQEVAVYDSTTFQHERDMKIMGMTDPLDIASSKDANCLYIVDRLSKETESKVVRIDSRGKVLHHWSTGGRMGRLSTYGSNVILCLSDKHLINEYSSEGKLIVTVRLSPAAKLNNPLHAIKVTSTHFVVSHGDFSDELHRVCVVNLNGEIIKECTRREESSIGSHANMKVPLCLLEDNEGSVIVADTDRKRLLLLSSMLKYQRKLIVDDNGLKDFPVRLCFDDAQGRLFVAVNKWSDSKKDWKDGRILIFNIK